MDMPSTTAPSNLLTIPPELRARVLSYLLPDTPTIEGNEGWSPTAEGPPRGVSPLFWDPGHERVRHNRLLSGGEKHHMEILRVNRQLYLDGIDFLYRIKTYKISLCEFGFDFLNESGTLRELPPVPYHEMKEFVIELARCNFGDMGCRYRSILLWLCGLLREHKIHFKKLRIEIMNYGGWDELWDSTTSGPPEYNPDSAEDLRNINVVAYQNGFESTLAYFLTPLALLPTATECNITLLPDSLREKEHFVGLAKWYEEGIDGTYPFNDDDWYVKQDLKEFEWMKTHPEGETHRCKCADCKEYFEEQAWFYSLYLWRLSNTDW